jgi:hypothetical protein
MKTRPTNHTNSTNDKNSTDRWKLSQNSCVFVKFVGTSPRAVSDKTHESNHTNENRKA